MDRTYLRVGATIVALDAIQVVMLDVPGEAADDMPSILVVAADRSLRFRGRQADALRAFLEGAGSPREVIPNFGHILNLFPPE